MIARFASHHLHICKRLPVSDQDGAHLNNEKCSSPTTHNEDLESREDLHRAVMSALNVETVGRKLFALTFR